jgi:beta-N-acetylhexosaminidase
MPMLREKIGQMFMIGIEGESLTRDEKRVIKERGFGGFILFRHNCHDPMQLLSLCRSLWATGGELRPFIAIDQEGGRVHRLPAPFTHFPAAALLGQKNDPNLAYRAGQAAAKELALVGINLNFAPVLDVHSNPKNPVIGDRSLASDPAKVSELSRQWMQGLRDGGVIPCGKHFPGHGDTDKDSHLELPVVDRSLDELRAVELPPFVHACQHQIESLMTAHVIYRSLDSKFPATLSHTIVTGLLRQQLGYAGVIFSDDMEMKAMSDNYGVEETVALAVGAGIDVVLYGHELAIAVRAFEFLCAEAKKHPAVRAHVEESYLRITSLKQRCIKRLAVANEKQLLSQIVKLDHRRIVSEIQGSL